MPTLSRLDRLAIVEAEQLGISLTELLNHYKNTKGTLRKTLREAVVHFLDAKGGANRSKDYMSQLEWALMGFVAASGPDRLVCDLVTADAMKWVGTGNAHTQSTKVARLRTFLRYCKRQGFTNEVVTDRLEVITKEIGEPEILSNAVMAKLLAITAENDPQMLEFLWLCGALGIRKAEAMKLKKDAIKDLGEFVAVGADIAKNRSRRLVKCIVKSPLKSGVQLEVGWQKNFRRRFDVIKGICGLTDWPKNALRHTAASHLVNYFSDENKAALHLGNSPQMIHRHYKGLVTPAQSEEFWGLWEK